MRDKEETPWSGLHKHYHPPGTEPGTLVEHHPECDDPVNIKMIQYGPDFLTEKDLTSLQQCWEKEEAGYITWINITGNYNPALLTALGEHYNLHPLSMEDVLNSGQHSKLERYDDYYFLTMYLLCGGEEINAIQVSIFWGKNYIITIEAEEAGAFEILRNRIRKPGARIREMGTDYLAYCLLDALIDRFFPKLEVLREELDTLEELVFTRKEKDLIEKIHTIKIKLLFLGKLIWASQELVDAMQNEEAELTSPNIRFYLRDCYDHTVQLAHTIDNYREISNGLVDSYISLISSQQNEIIKVLTMIATIFIPLTFLVGVYGMNFNPAAGPLSMPELNWSYGYLISWIVMIVISLAMIYYFKRRKWF